MKKIAYLFIIMGFLSQFVMAVPDNIFEIDAARNASLHNNYGVNHLKEKNYYSAIKEFEIAIMLNPNTQASAIYYNNLGKTYLKIGYANLAEESFDKALRRNSTNFEYYQNLVASYKSQNKLEKEFKKVIKDEKPVSKVIAGLILIEMGKMESGINILDEFCFEEPEMILTKGVRNYLQSIVPNEFR